MKYKITRITEFGNTVCPCYEVTVKQYPNFLEYFFGAHQEEFKCVSDMGLEWFRLPKYEKVIFNSSLDKVLLSISEYKRKISVQKLFEQIKEFKTKAITEEGKRMN